MDRYTFIKCETNLPNNYIMFLGYEPGVYQILHDGHVVGWLTDQYQKKNNWRIFPKYGGGKQIQPWDINTVQPISEVMAYIKTLPGSVFTEFDSYVYIEVQTEFGMTMYVSRDSGSGYFYLSHRPDFMFRETAEKINFEKDMNRNCTLQGDKIKSIEIKSIPVVS